MRHSNDIILILLLLMTSANAQSVNGVGSLTNTTGTGSVVLNRDPVFEGKPQLGIAEATNLILDSYLKLNATAISNLPKCDFDSVGHVYIAVDVLNPVPLAKAEGGGNRVVPVYCSGDNWTVF